MAFAYLLDPPKHEDPDLSYKERLAKMDLLGSTTLISAVVCLLLALKWGGLDYPWSDSKVFGCLIGFAGLLCCFMVIQYKRKEKQAPPSFFDYMHDEC